MSERPLPYGRQWIDEEDEAAVLEALRSPYLTQGPRVEAFEGALRAATGARHAIAVSNGTAALHIACLAAGVGPGSVGITSDVTFVASANCIRYAGGRPVLVDVDPRTGLIDSGALEAAVDTLSQRGAAPRVIIPVDLTGTVADLARVRAVAARVGALVIEDAAHSLGATYQQGGETFRAGQCAHTDLAILSFHPVKHVTTGEGGAVLTSDDALAATLRDLRTHGITKDPARLEASEGPWWYEQQTLGFNYRITDLQCALGVSQLRKLERFVARRREIAARYDAAFRDRRFDGRLFPLAVRADASSSYHLYVVCVGDPDDRDPTALARRRLALFLGLRERGVFAQVHYIPVHRQPDYRRNGLAEGAYPGADLYYSRAISLPIFPAMSDGDVDRVISAVAAALDAA